MTEEILTEIDSLYHYPASLVSSVLGSESILDMAKHAKLSSKDLITPSKRVSVMFVGNHSAGKSSFINYFSGTRVQRTGTAVETQGFTIVRASMSKSKKHGDVAEFNGETALMQSEALQHLTKEINDKDRRDFVEHLQLRIVQPGPTANPDFVHIDLIDTPGLVDGGLNYPFDVNDAICKMAVHIADLVLIFLDPQGQALCTRTMEVVERLEKKEGCSSKMRYYITKADTVATQQDLIKVSQQITTQLAVRIRHTHGYEAPCIWIPKELLGNVPTDERSSTKPFPNKDPERFLSNNAANGESSDGDSEDTTPNTASPHTTSPRPTAFSPGNKPLGIGTADNPAMPGANVENRSRVHGSGGENGEKGDGIARVGNKLERLERVDEPVLRQRKKGGHGEKNSKPPSHNTSVTNSKMENEKDNGASRISSPRTSQKTAQVHLAYIEPANALNRVLETISHITETRVLRNLTTLIDHSKKIREKIELVIEEDWKTNEQRKKWYRAWYGGCFQTILSATAISFMLLTPLVKLLPRRVFPALYAAYYDEYVTQPVDMVLQGFFQFFGYSKTYQQVMFLLVVLSLGMLVMKVSGRQCSQYSVMSSQERLKAYERVRNCATIEKRAKMHLGNIILTAQGSQK